MNARSLTTSRRPRVALAVSALAAITLVGACTKDSPDPAPSGSGNPTSSPTASFVPSDQSAKVLATQLPTVQGTTVGTLRSAGGDARTVTLNIAEVKATPTGTSLTFWYSGEEMLGAPGEYSWELAPVLLDRADKTSYDPLTFVNDEGDTLCLCHDHPLVTDTPRPRTILYPTLPDTVTTIEVRQAGFDEPVTVPVTR